MIFFSKLNLHFYTFVRFGSTFSRPKIIKKTIIIYEPLEINMLINCFENYHRLIQNVNSEKKLISLSISFWNKTSYSFYLKKLCIDLKNKHYSKNFIIKIFEEINKVVLQNNSNNNNCNKLESIGCTLYECQSILNTRLKFTTKKITQIIIASNRPDLDLDETIPFDVKAASKYYANINRVSMVEYIESKNYIFFFVLCKKFSFNKYYNKHDSAFKNLLTEIKLKLTKQDYIYILNLYNQNLKIKKNLMVDFNFENFHLYQANYERIQILLEKYNIYFKFSRLTLVKREPFQRKISTEDGDFELKDNSQAYENLFKYLYKDKKLTWKPQTDFFKALLKDFNIYD